LEVIYSNSLLKAEVTSKLEQIAQGLVPLSSESLQGLTFFYCDPGNLFNHTNHEDLFLMN